jgi:phosphoribosylamine--glycine ligase
MNVLVIGSGGREHALAWKIKQSPLCDQVFIAPGNGGTQEVATHLSIKVDEPRSLKAALKSHNIDMLVIGPEAPLVSGLVDDLQADESLKNLLIIGPGKSGALLEGSKDFAKQFMKRHGIPTAEARVFSSENLKEGLAFLEALEPPYVLKADGLAAGKGVIITRDLQEAKETLTDLIEGRRFGDASAQVLIEEFLSGIEVSFFVLTDGESFRILPEAKDYKRIGENDEGPNTGGMGAVSPVVFADRNFKEKVKDRIIAPTIEGLKKEGIAYRGFIFFGLMNVKGDPYVIEYNVRLGDPETQVVLPRIKTDFLALLKATAEGNLIDTEIEYERYTATTVVCVSHGYPGKYEKGKLIREAKPKGVITFHAGTSAEDGKLKTDGGRVIAVTGLGKNLGEAISKALKAAEEIKFEGKYFRKDIGMDLKGLGQ